MLENGKRKGSAMNIEIAQRLYELRRKHGFSQEALAEALGLSRQAISKWERSESAPDMGNLIALADLYGMTIDELIRPTDETEGSEDAEEVDSIIVIDETADAGSNAESAAEEEIAENILEASGYPSGADASDDASAATTPEAEGEGRTEAEATSEQPTQTTQSAQSAAIPDAPTLERPAPHAPTDVKQVIAHGHIYTKPTALTRPRCKLRKFPYPLLVTVLFIAFAIIFSFWDFLWLFLTIPFYYWIARIIERDPVFLANHGFAPDGTPISDDRLSPNESTDPSNPDPDNADITKEAR